MVAKKGAALSVALARVSARVAVETNPPGLFLRIDGHDAGKSPLAAQDYNPGPHEFLVDDPCYAREGERTVLKKGEDRTVHITPAPRLAGLDVSAEDAQGNAVEAKVLVDGQEVGTTPGTFKVSACAKKLELRSGDSGDTQALTLAEGKVQTIRSKLSRQSGPLAVQRLPRREVQRRREFL